MDETDELEAFRSRRKRSLLGNEDLDAVDPSGKHKNVSKRFHDDERRYDSILIEELGRWWSAGHTHMTQSKREAENPSLDFAEYKMFYQRLVFAFNVRPYARKSKV